MAQERLTDRKPLIPSEASENLEFYVVDREDKSEHPDGSSYRVTRADLITILGVGSGGVDLSAYQKREDKGVAYGYPALDALTLLPIANHNIEGSIATSPLQATPFNASIWGYVNSAGNLVRTTWAGIIATLQAVFDLRYRPLHDRLITASVSATYTFAVANAETWRITMTANTIFSVSNLPAAGFTKTYTIHMSGDFAPTWPASWSEFITGAYDGTKLNTIVVEYVNGTLTKVQITQQD